MNLKRIRLEQELSVPDLVKLSGVSRRTIQQAELADNCRVDTAIKLADALGVSLDELCRDVHIPTNQQQN